MRRLYVFLKYQYNDKMLLWFIIMSLTSVAFTYGIIKAFSGVVITGLCAKDMLLIGSSYNFPIYAGISVVKIITVTYIDNRADMLIRYNSRKEIFIYQCASALVTAFIDVVIMYAVGVFFAYIMLGVYDNWQEMGSWFYRMVTRRDLPLDIGVSDVCIYFNMIIRKTLIIWLVSIAGLFSEIWFKKLKTVIVMVILICAYSRMSSYGFMRLDLRVIEMYDMPQVIIKTAILLIICIGIVVTGAVMSRKHQYYK